jgi:nucleotide-binding universal stress UspA family protein
VTTRTRVPMRVLLATDGSNDAKAAVEWFQYLPLPPDRDVLVLTVVVPPLLPSLPDMSTEIRTALVADARRLADDTASELLTGRATTGRVVEGDPRAEIVAAAEDWRADLIVLGARGLGAIKEFLLGSVSLGVARHARCPVLVCKGTPRPLATVTVAIDGSSQAREALAWFAELPFPPSLRARLVGALAPQHFPSIAPGIVQASLRTALTTEAAERQAALSAAFGAAAEALRGRTTTLESVMERGVPADVIVRDAAVSSSDMIVMGARGLGLIDRLLLGSVSESVLRHAPCPVLIVRPTRSRPESDRRG